MLGIIGKKTGRPDFTTDTFVSTTPIVTRHQTRLVYSESYQDVYTLIDSTGEYTWVLGTSFPITLRGNSLYLMWFGVSLSVNVKVELRVGKIDNDKVIEYAYYGVPWTEDDMIVEEWGKAGGWGSVTINRGVNCPAVLEYDENAPSSDYYPDIMKYTFGFFVTIHGQPNTTLVHDISIWMSGMMSKYPWWY
jgi:hypothetical protein